jgi:hypothetical protein
MFELLLFSGVGVELSAFSEVIGFDNSRQCYLCCDVVVLENEFEFFEKSNFILSLLFLDCSNCS